MDMRLEVVVLPVSDMDRAKAFSVAGLADALRRAEAADGKHEEETGQPDPNWPEWYARYMANEREGQVRGEGEVGGT